MSLVIKDMREKVIHAAHDRLVTIAQARGMTLERLTSEVIEKAMLGDGYKEILAAERMVRLGMIGNNGDRS